MKLRAIHYGSPNRLIAYEYTDNYCYHLDRKGIPLPWSGLELSHGSRLHRERPFLDAFPRPMACLGAAGRKRDPGVVLVLEHRRKHSHVSLFYFPTRSDWHSGLSPQLAYLHSQSDVDSEAQVCFHRGRTFPTSARDRLMKMTHKR
jgi:hypothetical protein